MQGVGEFPSTPDRFTFGAGPAASLNQQQCTLAGIGKTGIQLHCVAPTYYIFDLIAEAASCAAISVCLGVEGAAMCTGSLFSAAVLQAHHCKRVIVKAEPKAPPPQVCPVPKHQPRCLLILLDVDQTVRAACRSGCTSQRRQHSVMASHLSRRSCSRSGQYGVCLFGLFWGVGGLSCADMSLQTWL